MQKGFPRFPTLTAWAENQRGRWLEWATIAAILVLLAAEIIPLGLYFASNASFMSDVAKMPIAK